MQTTSDQFQIRSNAMAIVVAAILFVLMLALPEMALAGTERVTEGVENVVTLLTAVGIGIISVAIMVAGYKMAFSGARLSDVSNILIGGVLAGGASGLAAWVFS